jgi:hypothetical protein
MAIVIVTWLIAGSLDLGAALLFFLSRGSRHPGMLLRYIASAVFGKKAFSGGSWMVVLGICFHFVIACCWVGLYFGLYPLITRFGTGIVVDAIVYGLVVWCVMNLLVLPLSRAVPRPFSLSFMIINMVILMITIGLPCAYAVRLSRG